VGLVQAVNVPASSLQRKLTPRSPSEKVKVALVWLVGFAGFVLIVGAGGGVLSIVQLYEVAELVCPAEFLASTLKLWLPAVSGPKYVCGLVQVENASPSSEQRKLTPDWLSVKAKVALVWFVGFVGAELIVGAGTPAAEPATAA
jgi:hypothetical protein